MIPTFIVCLYLEYLVSHVAGSVPDGQYDRNTKIYYCCRTDGTQSMKLTLPTGKPFYLLKYGSRCQEVGSKTCSHQSALHHNLFSIIKTSVIGSNIHIEVHEFLDRVLKRFTTFRLLN